MILSSIPLDHGAQGCPVCAAPLTRRGPMLLRCTGCAREWEQRLDRSPGKRWRYMGTIGIQSPPPATWRPGCCGSRAPMRASLDEIEASPDYNRRNHRKRVAL